MKAVLVLLSLGAAVMAQSFVNIEGFDVQEYSPTSMPQRVYANQAFKATITGKNIRNNDYVGFTAGNDCRTVLYATAVTSTASTSGTITYASGVAAQAATGNLRLCYKRVNDDGTNNGWQYYGTQFSLAVTSVDSWTDGFNTQLATGGVAQSLTAVGTDLPIRFYASQALPTGSAAGALTISGKNVGFSGDKAYAVTPSGTLYDGSSCNSVTAPSAGNLSGNSDYSKATFSTAFGLNSGGTIGTSGLGSTEGIYWVCYSLNGVVSTASFSTVTRFDTKLRAVNKARANTDYNFIFPRVVKSNTAAGATTFKLAAQTMRTSILGMRPGDQFFFVGGLTCANGITAPTAMLTPAAGDYSVNNGYISVKLTIPTDYEIKTTSPPATTGGAAISLFVCHIPAGMTTAFAADGGMGSTTFLGLASDSTAAVVAANVAFLSNDFANVGVQGAFLRGMPNVYFYGGFIGTAAAYSFFVSGASDPAGTACSTTAADYTAFTADWPIVTYNPPATTVFTNLKFCIGASAAGATVSATSVKVYGGDFTTGATTVYALPTAFDVKSQNWFMSKWDVVKANGGTTVPTINWWGAAANANGGGSAKLEWILSTTAAATGNGNLCPQFMVNGLCAASGLGQYGAKDTGSIDSNLRKGAVCSTASPAMPNLAKDIGAATVFTVCLRVNEPGTPNVYGSWFSTTLKVTQFPEISFWPIKVLTGSSGTTKIYSAGAVTGDMIGFEDIGTGTDFETNNGFCTKFGAAVGADGAVTVTYATGTFANANTHALCIKRSPNTNTNGLALRHSATNVVAAAAVSVGAPSSYDDAGENTSNMYSTSGGLTLKWDSSFADMLDDTKSISVIAGTSCTSATGGSKPTISYKWSWSDAGARAVTSTPATVTGLGKGASPIFGNGKFCYGTDAYSHTVRVFNLKGSCSSTDCAAGVTVKATSPFKVDTVGDYYPITGTAYDIFMDTTNGQPNAGTKDEIVFILASSTTVPTGAGTAVTVVTTYTPDATAQNVGSKLAAASVAGAGLTAGGLYNAWFSATDGAWYKTTSTITVVKLNNRYPGSVVYTDSSKLYLDQAGMNGNVYLTSDATCAAYTAPSATVSTHSAKGDVAAATGTAPAFFNLPALALSPAPTADVTWSTFCYKHTGQETGGTTVPPYVKLSGFTTLIEKKDTLTASIVKPTVSNGNTNVIVLSEVATTITLTNAGDSTIDGYTPFVGATVADCTAATPVKPTSTTTKITKIPTSWTDSTFSVTVKLTATVIADVAKNTNPICYNIKSSGTLAPATESTDLAKQIEVRPVPAKVGAAKPYILNNLRSGDSQVIDITYATGVTVTLKDTDVICLALPEAAAGFVQGLAAPGRQQLGTTPESTAASPAYYYAYCAQVASDGASVSFPSSVSNQMASGKDYEVWAVAGANAGASSGSGPAKVTGSLIRVLTPDVRPRNVVSTATGEKRILYTLSDASADQFHFAAGSGTACTGITTANPGAATAGKLSASFDTADTYSICYLSNRETSATKANWLRLDATVVARDSSATSNIKSSGTAGTIMLPRSSIKPDVGATDYYIKFHSGVATAVNFAYGTSAAQENDVIRVLAWTSTLPTAASCDTQAPTDAPTDAAKNAGSYNYVKDSASVGTTVTLTALPAAAYNSERLACYKQAGVSATPVFKSFPGTTWVRIVTLDAYLVGSSSDALAVGGAGTTRATNALYQFQVNFWGRWIDIDDFASFVDSTSTDCSKAWWYENAVYGATAAAVSTTAAGSGFSTWFESGLPGGLYSICYLAGNTGTGYNLYSALQNLRVLNVKVFPSFGTPGVLSTFTLTPTTTPGTVAFVGGDRQALTAAGGDCSTLVTTLANLTAGPSATFTVTIPGAPATAKSYEVCASLVGSTGYNFPGSPDKVDTSGNLGASFNSMDSSSASAARATDADDSASAYHIRVLYTPTLAYVWPNSVVRGVPTDLTFFGSYLDGGDMASFNLSTNGDECAAPAYETMAPNPAVFNQNWAMLKAKTFAASGLMNICYKTANATGGATKTSVHGQTVSVVAVTAVAPTGASAATFLTATAATSIKLTGFFNTKASAATNPNQDFDQFAIIPRNFQTRDCSSINTTIALGYGNRLTAAADGTSATGAVDNIDAPAAGEYMFCVHFAGSAWSNPINPAKDFFLVDPRDATFSVRAANSFAPTTVVNGTIAQTTVAQTVYLSGFGIRENDTVTTVPSTSTSVADCSDASKAVPPVPVLVGAGGAVSFSIPSAGSYRLCWKSTATGAAFEFVGSNTTLLTAESATIKTLVTQIGGVPTTTARTVDVADYFQVVLTGTGLMAGDSARLVNTSIISGGCEPTGAATSGATPWVKVAAANPLAPTAWWWEIAAGDVSVGTYGLCYQWSAAASKVAYANLTVTVVSAPRALAASPRVVTKVPGTTNFLIYGSGLDRTDSASLVAATGNCQALGTATTVTVKDPGSATTRALVNVTLPTATENTYKLCYFVGGKAPGRDLGAVVVAKEQASCAATQRFFCNGQCLAFGANSMTSPCSTAAPQVCPAGSGTVPCPATGLCARTPDECSSVATTLAAQGGLPACPAGFARCFDGSCAPNALACTPIAAPAPGLQRCKDGSLSTNGACLNKDGTAITKTCAGAAAPGYCPAGGCPVNGGTDVKEGCAPYDGCPVGMNRCPDCICRTSCGSAFGPFTCSDGKVVPNADNCACHRFAKIPTQQLDLSTGAVRRRFVVRASQSFTDINLVNTNGQIVAKVSVEANIALDGGKCSLAFMSVGDSIIDAAIPVATQTTLFVAAPVVVMSVLNGTTNCKLDATKGITVTFPITEVTSNMTCNQLFVSGASVAAGPNPNSCRINGTSIAAAAVTLATFPVVPKVLTPPVPSASASPSTLPPSATPSPGSANSPAPNPGTSTTSDSSASVSSFSALLVIVACSILAALF